MEVSKLLERWCVILLPRVCEPCSLEAWSVGTMLYDWGRKVRLPLCMWASADLSGVAKAWKERGAGFLIVCVHELLECVEPWLSLTLSFFLSLFSSFLSFFLSSFFISLPFFLSFFLFFEQARSDTFLKQGYSFGCLELCSETLSDFPHTWTFVWKSSVQCRGFLSSVFQLRRDQSVQLMQTSCSRASYVPRSS